MKKNLIYAGMLLLGMTVATGCSNEESLEQVLNNGNVIEAVIENPTKGRTSVSDNYQVLWTAEDAFSVFDNGTKKATLTLSGGEGTTSGKFTIENNDVTITEDMVALFPASETLSYTFAESYTSQETDAPMSATFADGKFTFSLLTAMVRVVVEDVPAGNVSMTISSNDLVLTGEAALNDRELGVPTTGKKSVSVNFITAEAGTLTFDVPVPVQNYTNGLSVVVKSDDTEVLNKTTNAFDAKAGKLYLFGAAYVSVSNAEAATEQLKEDGITAVKVQSVEADDVIAIPAKSEASAQTEHIIDLSSATLPTDGSVSIDVTEATDGDTGSTVEKLTVVVPNNATSGSLTINAPGTTVTIQGADGTVIDTIEATTAENTLIVGAGVTVKSLTINKGNVVLEDGANVELFKVNDPAGFKTAFALGGNIELQNDIDLNLTSSTALTIESGKTVNIDLNNNKLTTSTTAGTGEDITIKGKLNILDGTVEAAQTALYADGGELVLSNCTIAGNNPNAAAVVANGNTAIIDATNCTVTAANSAFYAFGDAEMTLTNCTVSKSQATTTALVAISGSNAVLTIDGGSYTGQEVTTAYDKYVIGVLQGAKATINTTVSGGNGGVTVIGASTAELTGGSYSGVKACGLYVAGESTVTYSNCTFSGVEGDVVVGGGTYGNGTVNGTKYTEYTQIKQVSTAEELESIIESGGHAILASNSTVNLTQALTVAAGLNVTIDLNNSKLTTSTTAGTGEDITIKGKLNILNGTIEAVQTALYADGGELVLSNCTIAGNNPDAAAVAANGITAKIEATNCTVTAANSAFYAFGGAQMTLTDCTVSKSQATTTALVAISGSNAVLTIDGGSYTGQEVTTAYDKYVIGVLQGAEATINTTVSGGNGGVTVIGASTAELTGGSYSGVKACGLYIDGESTVTYSNNCTFSGVEGAVVVGNQNGGGTVNDTKYTVYTKIQ